MKYPIRGINSKANETKNKTKDITYAFKYGISALLILGNISFGEIAK